MASNKKKPAHIMHATQQLCFHFEGCHSFFPPQYWYSVLVGAHFASSVCQLAEQTTNRHVSSWIDVHILVKTRHSASVKGCSMIKISINRTKMWEW